MGINNTDRYRIMDIDQKQRPREKLANFGPQVLQDEELIAILLRTGLPGENAVELGRRLLEEFGGILGLHQASYEDVTAARGIGMAKAAQLKAAIELGRRLNTTAMEELPTISSPKEVASLVQYEMISFSQEHLWVLHLNTKNQVIGINKQYKGTLNSSTVRISELFRKAIMRNVAFIILVHNHPSGDPTPSPEDVRLTRAVVEAGELLDVSVLDHVVIGYNGKYVSMKQQKLGFH